MNKKISIVLLPLAVLSLFSCKKLLEVPETDFIDANLALTTVANNEQAVIGAYAGLGAEMDIRFNGVFSDELKPGDFYASASIHEWQYTSNDIGIRDNFTATTNYYYVVNRVNRVIRALNNMTIAPADQALASKVKGEALYLRAFCHFELFRYYCGNYNADGLGMPYITIPADTLPKTYGRIKMGPYFDSLEKDLTESKTLMVKNRLDVARANIHAASALQARVALYKKDWANAITYATQYIDSIPLASKTTFPNIWKDASNDEIAFKLRKTNATTRVGSWYRGVFTKSAQTGQIFVPASIPWVPSDKLWNSFDQTNDIRFNAYLINEPLLQAVAGKPSKIVNKYAGTGYTTTNENVNDIKLFRTAEMYLIRAEARAELGIFSGANSAESDLNTLRRARINDYVDVVLTSKEDAITQVVQERFKELAFEGHRFWDLKRKSLPIERLDSDAPSSAPASKTLPANNFRFVLPIPQSEILANSEMQQNPGYTD